MGDFERIICQSLSQCVEDNCIKESGVEKDNVKGKYLSTLELEDYNALNTDKIEARLRQRTSSQSLWEAFVLHAPAFVKQSDQLVIPSSYQEVQCLLE